MTVTWLKYFTAFKVHFKDQIYYPGRAISYIFLTCIRVGVIFFLYAYAFDYVGQDVNGIGATIAIWSIAMYFIVFSFEGRGIFALINQDVISGRIELFVNKPYHYVLFRAASQIGTGLINGMAAMIFGVFILAMFVGVPDIDYSLIWAIQVGVIFILSLALCLAYYGFIGLVSFWLEDAVSLYWLTDKLVMLFGGAYLPVALFPGGIRVIAEYSPFGACMFLTHIFYPEFADKAWGLIGLQLFWLLLIGLGVHVMFKRATSRLVVNGG